MFSRISSKKETNAQPKDENIRNEARLQDEDNESLLSTGNQNMINIMNENNIMNDNNDDPFGLNEFFAKKESGQKNNDIDLNNLITNEINEKGMREKDDSLSQSGSLIIDTRSDEKKEANRLKKLGAQKAPQVLNLINNIAAPQKQKESKFEQDARLNGLPLFAGEIFSDADNYEAPEEDNIAVAPKKTRKKKSSIDLSDINDLSNADKDMKNAEGRGFVPVNLDPRKKTGSGSRFLTGMARFFGKTLGKVLNLAIVPFSAFHLLRGWFTSLGSKSDFQEKRNHDEIPGWNGRKFQQDPEGNANILADFRQVPTVWSQLTADKAVDDKGNPLPPEVSINVSQPKEGSDQMMNGLDAGHTGMGIEYTRFSKSTGRYERYKLRFGFFQAGATFSTGVINDYAGAYTMGQLLDESNNQYTVSRKFKANSKQVNAILQAARTYPDKGYHPLQRNCTTFVRDMMQVGNIAGAKNVITNDETDVSHMGNAGIFGAETILLNARAGQERNFAKLGRQKDTSYAGWGNMRATKEDYQRYNETMKKGAGFMNHNTLFANTPNSAAENLRRETHANAGDFGAMDYASPSLKKGSNVVSEDWFALGKACEKEGDNILKIINGIDETNPLDQKIKQSEEYLRITMNLGSAGYQLTDLAEPIYEYNEEHPDEKVDPVTTNLVSTEDIRTCRQALSQTIKEVNILLTKYYKNDKRLHIPVMHLISDLTYATRNLDQIYAERQKGAKTEGELGELRADMRSTEYKFYYGEDMDKEVSFTPTHYESYLQIYKTPQAALENYAKLKELVDMENNHQKLSSAQKKELAKLRRMEDLANQFDTAHEYMLEKDAFSQQDINYAFEASALQRSASADEVTGDMLDFHQTSGDAYQSLFLQKIFGGMEQRFKQAQDEDSYQTDGEDNGDKFQQWLDNDMTECVNKKAKGMMMILKGMKRALPDSKQDKDNLMAEAKTMILYNWVKRIFQGKSHKELFAQANAADRFYLLMDDNKSRFRRTIEGLVKTLLAEDKIKAPDPKMVKKGDKSNDSTKAVGNKRIKKK
ncbi:MAG: hypothetical protein IJI41_09305 [Anaerolineaceae bacterium]|nr:hypothetical protein [Anaerolineaceae bacterium]